jgi:predicted phosphatase
MQASEKVCNEFKGYSLFNDIEDIVLRDRNRAVVLANICSFNTKDKKINAKGMFLTMGYFNCIPPDQRANVLSNFESMMNERGFEKSS